MSYFFQGFPTILYDVNGDGKPIEATNIFRSVRLKPETRDNMLLYTSYVIQDGERPDHVSMKLYNSSDYYWTFFMVNENLVNIFSDWPLSTLELENAINVKYAGEVLTVDRIININNTQVINDMSNSFIQGEIIKGAQSYAEAKILEKDINTGVIKIEPISGIFRDDEAIIGQTSKDIISISGQRLYKEVVHHYEDTDGNVVGKYNANGTLNTNAFPISNEEHERQVNENKSTIQVIKPQYIAKVASEFFNQINPEQE